MNCARSIKLFREICAGRVELTLQRRLFAFFLLFLATVMTGLLLVFFASDLFSTGLKESRIFLENELYHVATNVEKDFGSIALQGISLSKRLTEQLEKDFSRYGLTPETFRHDPDSLEVMLDDCLDVLSTSLEKNKVSAAFFILDTTVNPSLEHAATSRAGIFLKNMAPNAAYDSPTAIRYMRGPTSIAKARNMVLLPQWQMEFTIESDSFYHTVLNTKGNTSLSRLYYWQPRAILYGDYEKAMILAVPLIASDGTTLGVCGFEVSDMLFKMQYTPDNTGFKRIFAMLAPLRDETPDASRAMLAGSYTITSARIDGDLTVQTDGNGISSFTGPDGATYAGLYQSINLYPKDAIHGKSMWLLSIVMPQQDLLDYMMAQNQRVLLLLAALCILGAVAAAALSSKYTKPVVETLRNVQTQTASSLSRTRIPEIDDLIEYLAEMDATRETLATAESEPALATSSLFDDFARDVETLSPAEKAVFNLYMEGYKAKEIADILCLSINTIKTHNKRIYMKLKVSSREELLVYVKMLQEKGGVLIGSEK